MEDGYYIINRRNDYGRIYLDKRIWQDYQEREPYSIRYEMVSYAVRSKDGIVEVSSDDYIVTDTDGKTVVKSGDLVEFYRQRWKEERKEDVRYAEENLWI